MKYLYNMQDVLPPLVELEVILNTLIAEEEAKLKAIGHDFETVKNRVLSIVARVEKEAEEEYAAKVKSHYENMSWTDRLFRRDLPHTLRPVSVSNALCEHFSRNDEGLPILIWDRAPMSVRLYTFAPSGFRSLYIIYNAPAISRIKSRLDEVKSIIDVYNEDIAPELVEIPQNIVKLLDKTQNQVEEILESTK